MRRLARRPVWHGQIGPAGRADPAGLVGLGQVVSAAAHRVKLNAPTRIIAAPATLPVTSPNGIVFSSRTKMAIAAIHSRFITPPTKSSPIRIQQQPTQYSPSLSPIRKEP